MDFDQRSLGFDPLVVEAKATPEILEFFRKLEWDDRANLFVPGNCFELIDGERKILYAALDPRQRPPKDGKLNEWISVDDELPPEIPGEYLVAVRSGGPPYGEWEYNYDIGYWNEYWDRDGRHGFDWVSITCDWDGDVKITHWMPIPELPNEQQDPEEREG